MWDSKHWLRSREHAAIQVLTNQWSWRSSEDWCEIFGCCGRGWKESEDEAAYAQLRTAHFVAGLALPKWIAEWKDLPPRRRDPDKALLYGWKPTYPTAWRMIVIPRDQGKAT
jgi:hypothetical protein